MRVNRKEKNGEVDPFVKPAKKPGRGSLYLIPTTLGAAPPEETISAGVLAVTRRLRYFLAENQRSARRYLKVAETEIPLDHLILYTLDKRTKIDELPQLIRPLLDGHDMGLISEAGMPGIADPGAEVVSLCHAEKIRVVPCAGPSSILLALIGSGFNGQRFSFHGYLPIDKSERAKKIKSLLHDARVGGGTQIFMETPFRNDQLMEDLLRTCPSETRIGVAADLTLPGEFIATKTAGEWKRDKPNLDKRPAIFLIGI